jgi:hypothetical protein
LAVGTLTLGIPGSSATTFATEPIPSLALFRASADGPLAVRSELGYAVVAGRSVWGTAQILGPTHKPKYVWSVAAMMTEGEARQLGSLAKWQSANYRAKIEGALRLIDETELLDDEPNPHSRTLLSSLVTPWNSGYRYGYGVFSVAVQLPEDWRSQVGRWASGSSARLCTFNLVEL